jgi:MFS family permease
VLKMFNWPRFEVLGIAKRDFAIAFTLLFNTLSWSYMVIMMIERIPINIEVKSSLDIVFSIAAAGAGLSGALLSEKIKRLHFLYFWMILGIISSFLLIFINSITIAHLSLILIMVGISFGLGMPSSLAHLADNSSIDNRARISSLIVLPSNLSILPLTILFMTPNLVVNAITLTIWRGLGLALFALFRPKEIDYSNKKKHVSFASVFRDRPLVLYLIPWVMFCLIDAFENALLSNTLSSDLQTLMLTIEPLIAVLFMFISGLLADRIGRKRIAICGFISIGIGYAIVSLAPAIKEAWYFYFVVDGVAWGIFFTIFLLTLWGDLSQFGAREKYYAVASIPFIIRSAIPILFISVISSISDTAAFSLASFFLFIAVLPLMYAPETLPQKKIEQRLLKGYIERAKKISENYLNKNGTNS